MTAPLLVGSLFSGIEGLGLGLERAGMRVAWQCEIDPDARAVLAHHYPDTPRYDDVRSIHAAHACPVLTDRGRLRQPDTDLGRPGLPGRQPDERPADGHLSRAGSAGRQTPGGTCERCVPAVDVLCGGFPCQDLSVAGRRAGLAGQRSGLFHQFMRLAYELAPRWVLIENVPGLLSSGHKPDCTGFVPAGDDDGDFDSGDDGEPLPAGACGSCDPGADMATVLDTLADLGYGWSYRVLDAQYFGVAQRRRRVFIVGCAGNQAGAAQVLFEPESCAGDSPPRREARARVAAGLTAGSATGSGVNRPGRRAEDDVNLVAAGEIVTGLTGGLGSGGPDAAHAQAGWLVPEVVGTLEAGTNTTGGTRPPGTTVDTADSLIPEIVPQAMTSKWAKGSSGPAGDEHHNLLPVEGGAVGFHLLQDPCRDTEDVTPAMTAGSDQAGAQLAVAYPLAMRGRADGAELEMGDDDVYNALRAGDGGSSRQNLVLTATPIQDGRDVEKAQNGVGVGSEDDPAYTLDTTGAAAVAYAYPADCLTAVAYRKAQKAHDPDDCERWEEADVVDTVSSHSTTSGSAVVQPMALDLLNQSVDENGLSHTLRDGHGVGLPALLTEMAVRRLTPTECERLQGFPDSWTASLSDSARYRVLGNAVCVPVAAWIGRRIMEATR